MNFLRNNKSLSESKIYYFFLWGIIAFGVVVLLMEYFIDNDQLKPLRLLIYSSSMNGGVMFIYSALLLYMNKTKLPSDIGISWWRGLILVWSTLFFGFFTLMAVWYLVGR